jgi:hypothetical protein
VISAGQRNFHMLRRMVRAWRTISSMAVARAV